MCRIKLCGIKTKSDLHLAERHGANAVGFLVGQRHNSPDFLLPEIAAELCSYVSPFMVSVLVTHLEDEIELMALLEQVPCPVIQLHSDLSLSSLKMLRKLFRPRKIIGKVSVEDESARDRARELADYVDAIILDSIDRSTNRVGGTGLIHDWVLSAKIVQESPVPIILAGGLNPKNVKKALEQVRPWAIDVNTGVNACDGRKSEALIKEFVQAARQD